MSKCKAVFVLASFHNASGQFFEHARCSNFSKLSESSCQVTGLHLIAGKYFARLSHFRIFSPLLMLSPFIKIYDLFLESSLEIDVR